MNFTSDNPPFSVQPDGVWHLYGATFMHGLRKFGINFYARNDAEASAMVQSMRESLSDCGRVVAPIGSSARNN